MNIKSAIIKTIDWLIYLYNNQLVLSKYKGSDVWRLKVNAGQYGEDTEETKFEAKGFKEAHQVATKQIIMMIKKGLELNV